MGEEDFTPLLDLLHERIAPYMSQNQRIESYVQLHANVARTNIKEARRSARGVIQCATIRPFNQRSVAIKRMTKNNLKEAEKIKRVKGHERIAWFADFVVELNTDVDIALQNTDHDKREQVMRVMGSCANKTSAIELKQHIDMYDKGIKKKRRPIKADDNPNGIHVTAEMGGKITLGILHKGKGHDVHVQAEIEARGIEPPKPLAEMEWKDIKNLLNKDEFQSLVEKDLAQSIKHWSDIKEVKPVSDKMKELFEYQAQYYLEKRANQRS